MGKLIEIRPATASDLLAICDLQIDSWRSTYRGFVTDQFLDVDVENILGAHWAEMPGQRWLVETVWVDNQLGGFIAVESELSCDAYVDNLHVADWAQGQGLGRKLMARAAKAISAQGNVGLWLTVIADNYGSRAFYRRIGGNEGAEMTQDMFGQPVRCLPVRWNNLSKLAQLSGGQENFKNIIYPA